MNTNRFKQTHQDPCLLTSVACKIDEPHCLSPMDGILLFFIWINIPKPTEIAF